MMTRCLLRVVGSGVYRRLAHARTLATVTGDDMIWENAYQREVPRTMEEMGCMLQKEVDSPPDARLLKVAVVGVPNCGKSTLINKLMGWRVCSVSSKVHTTELRARAVYNTLSTQLVFLDTPGLVSREEITKHGLKRSMLTEAELSLQEADIITVVHDVSNHFTRHDIHPTVLRLLVLHPTIPSILVLNKVDKSKSKKNLLDITRLLTEGIVGGQKSHIETKKIISLDKEKLIQKAVENSSKPRDQEDCLSSNSDSVNNGNDFKINTRGEKKDLPKSEDKSLCGLVDVSFNTSHYNERDVLEGKVRLTEQTVSAFIQNRKSWPKFEQVFMISALDGTGVDDLRDFFYSRAYSNSWIFSSQVVTDQNPQEIVLSTVREKFLDTFRNEIPYTLHFGVEYWDLSDSEVLNIVIRVSCRRRGLARLLVGNSGSNVSRIAKAAEQALRNTFRTEVRLRLNIVHDSKMIHYKK
ncbi:GTPase Era, mitochondrial isoform X1 [Procambarus clarkii]|uniref:GTPase Era, mitochondrial isoform X1 n=1 Tax=Procambarus clarkii TaxID=6728 RepID=UPI001E6727FE|nr:GTPase Era, mitochondrial-like [Procambarus clarkii]